MHRHQALPIVPQQAWPIMQATTLRSKRFVRQQAGGRMAAPPQLPPLPLCAPAEVMETPW